MKKTMIAAVAALMLAGALSAVGGATSISTAPALIIGEGSAPIPLSLAATNNSGDPTPLTPKF